MTPAPLTARRAMFRDAGLQRDYDRAGYAVVPFLDGAQIERLARRWHELGDAVHTRPFSASIMSADSEYRRAVNDVIGEIFAPLIPRLMVDYRFSFGSFVTKLPGNAVALPVHQDPQFVDEPEHESVNVWVPLVDVDGQNGCLRVMPGSHLLNRGPRGTNRGFPYAELAPLIESEYFVDVPMRAGEACITSHRTFHGSRGNVTPAERIVAAAIAVPAEAEMRYLYEGGAAPKGTIEVFAVDDEFFRAHVFGEPAAGRTPIDRVARRHDPLTPAQLAETFAGARPAG